MESIPENIRARLGEQYDFERELVGGAAGSSSHRASWVASRQSRESSSRWEISREVFRRWRERRSSTIRSSCRVRFSMKPSILEGLPDVYAARLCHLQTRPSTGSVTSPTNSKPHFLRTLLDAFVSGRV